MFNSYNNQTERAEQKKVLLKIHYASNNTLLLT